MRSKSTVLSCNSVKNLPRRRQQPRQSVQLRSGHVVRAGTHRVGNSPLWFLRRMVHTEE
ncbi:TPA: hypothetical protein NBO64_001089 [Corynebacterium striatum]|nr:hypothetical protein [Corynebacterium striatum]